MASRLSDGCRLSRMGINSCFSDRENIQYPHVEESDIRHWNLCQVATSQFFFGQTIECG